MLIVRCSSLDRVLACAASIEDAEAPYAPHNPEATEGRAGHKALRALARGTIPAVDDIAGEFGVDPDALVTLVSQGRRAWDEVEQWFPATERGIDDRLYSAELAEGVTLRGTPDLVAVSRERISILDWKLGWHPSEHPNQLRGYAYLARAVHGMPDSNYVLGVEVWARRGEYRVHKFTTEDLDRLRAELLEQVRLGSRQYGPSSEACRYCPRQNACRAREDWVRSGVSALTPFTENAPITPELLGALYDRRNQFSSALRRYDEMLAEALQRGDVPLPDGRKLTLEAHETEDVSPARALPVLRELGLAGTDVLDGVFSFAKSGLERVIKAHAPKGKGAAQFRAAMKRLRDAGAVTKLTTRRKAVI